LVVARGVALALYPGRHTRGRSWNHRGLLLNGLACASRWFPPDERDWLVNELRAELQTKKKVRDYTTLQAFCERRILRLIVAFFLALTGALGTIYWIPTFVKRLSGFPDRTVTSLPLVPALIGIAGLLINGWHSDESAERR
jgi:predicted MFS family arabinose efflux permease